MKNFRWMALAACAVLALAGCHNSGRGQNTTNLRVVNAVLDAEPLNVLVDDSVKASAVALNGASGYANFGSGTHDTKVESSTQGNAVLLDKSLVYASDLDQTLVLFGKRSSIQYMLLTDDVAPPTSGQFKVRGVGLSPDAGAVDVYFAQGPIDTATPALAGVSYSLVIDYVSIPSGSYQVIFTTAGTKEVLFQAAASSFAAGSILTLSVMPSSGGKLVNALFTTSNVDGGTFIANPLARVKAVNAEPDAPTLNFKLDGTILLSNVPFAGSSAYVTTTAGSHTAQIEASSVPGSNIATAARTIVAARDYTIVAANSYAQPQVLVLEDDNTLPATGLGKVRFVNAMAGSTGGVDVLVDFASQVAGLQYGQASTYFALAASTSYTLSFATSGGVTLLATLTPAEVDAGAVYTAYLLGTPSAPQAKLVRDR